MNGNYSNGNGRGKGKATYAKMTGNNGKSKTNLMLKPGKNKLPSSATAPKRQSFDQTVVLKQSPVWSRAILWSLIGVSTFAIGWASIAQMEQVVVARGQLKPEGSVKEIQVPLNGVVEQVFVEDGDQVKEGELLFILDSTTAKAELKSLKNIRQSLEEENQFYRALMSSTLNMAQIERAIAELKLPSEIALLARNRVSIQEENRLFRSELGIVDNNGFDSEQVGRLQARERELRSRSIAADLEIGQLQKQLSQVQVQLADAKTKLATNRVVLEQIRQRNQQNLAQAQASLNLEQSILDDVSPLVEEGALAAISARRQKQEVNDRLAKIVELKNNGQIEYDRQKQEVETSLADIQRLNEEKDRLTIAIQQGRANLINTEAVSEKDVRDRLAGNEQNIANIDSQLGKVIRDNQNRIAQIDSQISSSQVTLKYQEVRAPASGTVFDLKAFPGAVPNPNSQEKAVKIVPDDELIAEIYIDAKNIGFVHEAFRRRNERGEPLTADVRLDSFTFSEYGDIKGQVISIGSDALPPEQPLYNFYRFPAKIRLEKQGLDVNEGTMTIGLQSGMTISTNIRIREQRTVLSLLTESFTREVESLKQMQ
jgi:HlyD family secretion protein